MGIDSLVRRGRAAAVVAALLAAGPAVAYAEGGGTHPSVMPTPQSLTYGSAAIDLSSGVNVVSDGCDADALSALKAVFDAHGVSVNTKADSADPTLYLGEVDDPAQLGAAKKLGLDASSLESEGYVLGSKAADKTIVLNGRDGDGTFYAVQTFAQLLGGSSLTDVSVTDEPEMAHRGVIEGFYAGDGADWTWKDRQNQLAYYGKTKLNTYIYAPKDDPYHREKWREPYPADQLEEMKKLVQIADDNKVDFVFAISPGQTIDLTSEADFQALVNKCKTMYDMGVRHFAIFFDDISLSVSDPGTKQAQLLNRFQTEFLDVKGDCGPLITVPTKYDSLAMISDPQENGFNEYTNHFSKTLDPRIEVLYTGGAVVPEGIAADNMKLVKKAYGDRIGIWWNYNCNDYQRNKLALGPMNGLDNDLGQLTEYFVTNPMGWADMNKISEVSAADYGWNTDAYQVDASFKNAVSFSYGTGDLAQAMYTFANHSTRMSGGSNSSGRADAPEVRALMDRVLKKAAGADDLANDAEVAALRKEFAQMQSASSYLMKHASEVDSTNADVKENFAKLGAVGAADDKALDLLIAKIDQNAKRVDELTAELRRVYPSLTAGKLVSEGCGVKFVDDALRYEVEPTASFGVSETLVRPGQKVQINNTSSLSAAEYHWSFPGATLAESTEESPVVSYEHEGRYTITLTVKNKFGEDTAVQKQIVTVSNDAPEEVTNLALGKAARANGATGPAESAEKAVDGNTSTKWCSVTGPAWLQIDLGDEQTVTGYSLSNAAVGGEGSALNTYAWHLEVSSDGKAWTEVSRVNGNTQDKYTASLPVAKARYVRLNIDKPTSNNDRATRIFEFEVFGSAKHIDLPADYVEPEWKALDEVIAKYADITSEGYTASSWKAFDEARAAAQNLRASNYATQDQVDAAVKALNDAFHQLEKRAVFTVTFYDRLESTQDVKVQVYDGDTVARPDDPVCAGYHFGGWFTDASFATEWNFDDPVTSDMTLIAQWTKDDAADPVDPSDPVQPADPTKPGSNAGKQERPSGHLAQTGDPSLIAGIVGMTGSLLAGAGAARSLRARRKK